MKRRRVKIKVRGQQGAGLHRALQITVGTLDSALEEGGGGQRGTGRF